MGAVEKLIAEKYGVIQGATQKTEKGRVWWPVQQLYTMELTNELDDR